MQLSQEPEKKLLKKLIYKDLVDKYRYLYNNTLMIPKFSKLITDIEIQKAIRDNNLSDRLYEIMNFDPCIEITTSDLQTIKDFDYEKEINI